MTSLRKRDDAIVEEGLVDPSTRLDCRTTNNLACLRVFHHQQVFAVFDALLAAVEGPL